MKLEVYTARQECSVCLRLRLGWNGHVHLEAVNDLGDRISSGRILTIYPDGRIGRARAVNKALGFQQGDGGTVETFIN